MSEPEELESFEWQNATTMPSEEDRDIHETTKDLDEEDKTAQTGPRNIGDGFSQEKTDSQEDSISPQLDSEEINATNYESLAVDEYDLPSSVAEFHSKISKIMENFVMNTRKCYQEAVEIEEELDALKNNQQERYELMLQQRRTVAARVQQLMQFEDQW